MHGIIESNSYAEHREELIRTVVVKMRPELLEPYIDLEGAHCVLKKKDKITTIRLAQETRGKYIMLLTPTSFRTVGQEVLHWRLFHILLHHAGSRDYACLSCGSMADTGIP